MTSWRSIDSMGEVFRIAPNEVSIVDVYAMKHLYGHGHNAPMTDWYSVSDPPNTAPQIFSELAKKYHGFLRKRLASAYSLSSVLKYEVYIQNCLDLLLDRLRKRAEAGEVVDTAVWTNASAFGVVGELGYGTQLGRLKTESDVGGLRRNICNVFKLLSNMGHFPGQMVLVNNRVSQAVFNLFNIAPSMSNFPGMDGAASSQPSRAPGENKRVDLLAHFCRMKNKDGGRVAFGEIVIEALNLIDAGADTTSVGMRTCL